MVISFVGYPVRRATNRKRPNGRMKRTITNIWTVLSFAWAYLLRDASTRHYWKHRHDREVIARDDEIHEMIDRWRERDGVRETLPLWLGWTHDEYHHWLTTAEPPVRRAGII